ncbi:hypothetical protein [Vibrio nigripulchritudo]|uniref:hypothetical protein n=1 Tax=Vibrio nigripulchritudo TaxID=28173 RepID=UPI00129BBE81|nr:hypothetical protein [Vibrio nigripulchritudo]
MSPADRYSLYFYCSRVTARYPVSALDEGLQGTRIQKVDILYADQYEESVRF